ncbi:transglutaminase domain-containing protein [Flexithrix dorotheae]|uniref:transglutaminase domain-containing protein n=1 Tax=Flexithrix dorotheae TaxID=70993 RepID=UPI00146D325D|nr:transglutaminase domain-containing protein [Flexithrix dorotheae]
MKFAAFSQEEKFGKIEKKDLEMKSYPLDTAASAVVLFDVGKTYFQYTDNSGFQLIFERHRRVKVLTKDGYDYGNFEIYVADQGESDEKVSGLKGYTYKLKNGKIEKVKLEKEAIHKEKFNDNLNIVKFNMPNIEEGVVFEFQYKIVSDFITYLKPWQFQEEIPVVWSEYTTEIPEYFYYQKNQQGYLPVEHSTGEKTGSISQMYRTDNGSRGTSKIDFRIETESWVLKNGPAFNGESYITTPDDYVSKITYQLATTKFPNSPVKDVLGSWDKINQTLLEHERFGSQAKKKSYFNDIAKEINAQHTEPEAKLVAAYQYISQNIKWNESHSFLSKENVKKALEKKTGNVADINLALNSLLNNLGFDANPVILSTRQNGRVNVYQPMLDNMNYVIVHVAVGEKNFLLDATDRFLPIGQIPFKCMNGQGRLISETNSRWINLDTGGDYTKATSVKLQIKEEGSLEGTMSNTYKNYYAKIVRKSVLSKGEKEYFKDNWEDKVVNFTVSDPNFENVKELGEPLITKFNISIEEAELGGKIYLDPIFSKFYEENPFKQEKREYPVDFGCPTQKFYSLELELPEGYDAEELPQAVALTLPQKAGRFTYQVIKNGNKLQIISSIKISKPVFLPDEYAYLKEFFTQAISKQSEQIVLVKKT